MNRVLRAVRICADVVFSLATVGFRKILRRHQVVGNGDGRQQDQENQCQCDELHAPARAIAGGVADPQPHHECGQQDPCEIESQLHELSQFYPRSRLAIESAVELGALELMVRRAKLH